MRHLGEVMSWLGHKPAHHGFYEHGSDAAFEHSGRRPMAAANDAAPSDVRGLPWRPIAGPSRHRLISLSRVREATVFDRDGRASGQIADLSLEKSTGLVVYAIVSFGGFFGRRSRLHPVPWTALRYDPARDGYVVPLSAAELDKAPTLTPDELEFFGAGDRAWREKIAAYYNPLLTLGAL